MNINFLDLHTMPVWEQLKIEEALLRADQNNWCILNRGTPPAIVMGISGKPELLINLKHLEKFQIPVWKRFSGGGTVVVDSDTLFVTFIFNSAQLNVAGSPETIHQWAHNFYYQIFLDLQFELRENDYVFENRKFGGNAQYICKGRWLHHTSFLWDYNPELMNCLLMPSKRPKYRDTRSHNEFLCALKHYLPCRVSFFEKIQKSLAQNFSLTEMNLSDISTVLLGEHRKATIELIPPATLNSIQMAR